MRLRSQPELGVVYADLLVRAYRDPFVAELLGQLDAAWRASLTELLEHGRAAGLVREDVDPPTVIVALMAMLKGLGIQAITTPDRRVLDDAVTQLGALVEGWLTADPCRPAGRAE